MPQYCCIQGCTNNRSCGVHLFKFPLRKKLLLEQWIGAINMEDLDPTKYSVICSKHFTDHDYEKRPHKNGVRLKQTAVPSIFSPTANSLETEVFELLNLEIFSQYNDTNCTKQLLNIAEEHNYCAASCQNDARNRHIGTQNLINQSLSKKCAVQSDVQNQNFGIQNLMNESSSKKYGVQNDVQNENCGTQNLINRSSSEKCGVQSDDVQNPGIKAEKLNNQSSFKKHNIESNVRNLNSGNKRVIMKSSKIHVIKQVLTPRERKMQRQMKTLRQKLFRRDKKIRVLKNLLSKLR